MTEKPHINREHLQALLQQMLRIRRFEEKCAQLYSEEKIRGFLHLYIGEEAVAVGVINKLTAEDSVVSTYREHGHALTRGVSMDRVLAEMYGKVSGCSKGRGGSMHLFDAATNFYGGNAIVGGGLPMAVGLAFANKRLCSKASEPSLSMPVVACFFGEGAVAEGEFHESLNLAALWQLPVLFICENNRYAMGTALSLSESQQNIAVKAQSYGIDSCQVDGMNVVDVEASASSAITAIREQGKPFLLECLTYRFRGHSMFDAQLYRDKEEVKQWQEDGPIQRLKHWLLENNQLTDQQLEDIERSISDEIDHAIDFAQASAWESVDDLCTDVYSPQTTVSGVSERE
jgi:pyruvate dehydrogenase E1 component alpha subunit